MVLRSFDSVTQLKVILVEVYGSIPGIPTTMTAFNFSFVSIYMYNRLIKKYTGWMIKSEAGTRKVQKLSSTRFNFFSNSFIEFLCKHAKNYPAPLTLNLSWAFGSLSLLALIIQIITGFWLTMHYVPKTDVSFDFVEHAMRDVNAGHIIRYTHANGASFYFVCLYCHIFRSLYYKTFIKNAVT